MVLSVLDIELEQGATTIPKHKIHYYVMAGDECIDSLILGSHASQTQNQQQ